MSLNLSFIDPEKILFLLYKFFPKSTFSPHDSNSLIEKDNSSFLEYLAVEINMTLSFFFKDIFF